MPDDDEIRKGIRNLEEILQRLDDQAQNLQWRKEHAPESPKIKHSEPLPPVIRVPVAAPVETAPEKPAETPVPVLPAAPVAPAPIAEPPVKAPTPILTALPPIEVPKAAAVLPVAPAPAVKPAKRPFAFKKKLLVFLGLGLAIAGAAYQLTMNSAKAHYAKAGLLVKEARPTAAISAYTQIIAGHAGSLEAAYSQFAIAEIKAAQGDLPGAIERYEKYLVAAPEGDAKAPQAKFNIAEIEFRQGNLPEAEYMYNNLRASAYAKEAADRLAQIKAVNAQVAGARKLMAKDPAKAVETFAAVLAAYPDLKAAAAGLEEAKKALAAANGRPAFRKARANKPRAPKSVRARPAPAPGKPAVFSKEQRDACNAVWMMEKIQGRLDADSAAAKTANNCDALKESMRGAGKI